MTNRFPLAESRTPAGSRASAKSRLHFIVGALAASFLLLAAARADPSPDAKDIQPPWRLRWGESAEQIEPLLKGAKANIVEKRKTDDGEAWTVEGLLQASLRRTIFYFKNGLLIAVELQYQDPSWDSARYNDFMAQIRQRIVAQYGEGQLVARSKEPMDGNVMQTVVGYKWSQSSTSLELFYFSAENATEIYRTISVHYKAY